MAKKNEIGPNQLTLFGDQPIAEEEVAPIPIIENWRGVGSLFIASAEDAAGDARVLRPTADGGVEETAPVVGELLVLGLDGPEIPAIPLRHQPRLRELVYLRDGTRRLLQAQKARAPRTQIDALRADLNDAYDGFEARYGRINAETLTPGGKVRRQNMWLFENDPDVALVAALEVNVAAAGNDDDEDEVVEKRFEKAPIFFRDTITPDQEPTTADTPLDALNISLDQRGRVDIHFMADLLGQRPGEVAEALTGEIFLNPETDEYEIAAVYLSGPVRHKLRVARRAAERDPRWRINVMSLEAVQPQDLTPEEIIPGLGAPWIPVEDVQDFVVQLLDCRPGEIRLFRDDNLANWIIRVENQALRHGARARRMWGTQRVSAIDLLEDGLNQRSPTVRDPIDNTEPIKYRLNREETMLAREKLEEIKAEFRQWIWRDNDRAVRLARIYNDLYNDQVEREYDGSCLTLPGSAANVELRPHQKNAIFRGVQEKNTLLAHRVGYGKTWEQVGIIMESRRLGHATKPMWIVMNNMIDEIPRQFLQLYPMARLLVPSQKEMTPKAQQEFFARMATSDADCVIMTHDAFLKLKISVEARRQILMEEIESLEAPVMGEDRPYEKSRMKKIARLQKELRELDDVEDSGLTFEDTGVDMFVVDESQHFKGLPLVSKNAQLSVEGSKKADECLMRVRHINRNGGKVVFATGTPIANSLVEVFVLMQYLHQERLQQLGLDHLDAWVAMFAEAVTRYEMSPAGGFEAKTRFSQFQNIPELRGLLREFSDVQLDPVEGVKLPAIRGGAPRMIALEPNEWQAAYFDELLVRIERIRNREVHPREDNILLVIGDAKKAALDPRLVDPAAPADGCKVQAVADEIARVYHEDADALQLVFCDLRFGYDADGRPHFDLYQALREELEARGVNPGHVAFAQDAQGKGERARFDAACNNGEIKVAAGSTMTLGTGRNVQRYVREMHDLDAPWRPCDLEQRMGRGIRQGNTYEEVGVNRYVTRRSPDGFVWGVVERKASASHTVLAGRSKARTVEDVDEVALGAKAAQACIADDPRVQRKLELEGEIKKAEAKVSAERRARYLDRQQLQSVPERRVRLQQQLELCTRDLAERVETEGEAFSFISESGTEYREREKAGNIMVTKFGIAEKRGTFGGHAVETAGRLGGFTVSFEKVRGLPPELIISNFGTYRERLDVSADIATVRGMVARVENMIDRVTQTHAKIEKQLEDIDREERHLRANLEGESPLEQELRDMYAELETLDRELGLKGEEGEILEEEEEVVDAPAQAPEMGDARVERAGDRFAQAIDREMAPQAQAPAVGYEQAMDEARNRARRALGFG